MPLSISSKEDNSDKKPENTAFKRLELMGKEKEEKKIKSGFKPREFGKEAKKSKFLNKFTTTKMPSKTPRAKDIQPIYNPKRDLDNPGKSEWDMIILKSPRGEIQKKAEVRKEQNLNKKLLTKNTQAKIADPYFTNPKKTKVSQNEKKVDLIGLTKPKNKFNINLPNHDEEIDSTNNTSINPLAGILKQEEAKDTSTISLKEKIEEPVIFVTSQISPILMPENEINQTQELKEEKKSWKWDELISPPTMIRKDSSEKSPRDEQKNKESNSILNQPPIRKKNEKQKNIFDWVGINAKAQKEEIQIKGNLFLPPAISLKIDLDSQHTPEKVNEEEGDRLPRVKNPTLVSSSKRRRGHGRSNSIEVFMKKSNVLFKKQINQQKPFLNQHKKIKKLQEKIKLSKLKYLDIKNLNDLMPKMGLIKKDINAQNSKEDDSQFKSSAIESNIEAMRKGIVLDEIKELDETKEREKEEISFPSHIKIDKDLDWSKCVGQLEKEDSPKNSQEGKSEGKSHFSKVSQIQSKDSLLEKYANLPVKR